MEALRRPTVAETGMHAEGAEFLVLGQLLIRGVHATKAIGGRHPGWDVLAANVEAGRVARIQVKARLATGAAGFPIKNLASDFVVLVALNRGYRRPGRDPEDHGVREPEYWVLPMAVVQAACDPARTWGQSWKVFLRDIPDVEQYRGAWDRITDFVA